MARRLTWESLRVSKFLIQYILISHQSTRRFFHETFHVEVQLPVLRTNANRCRFSFSLARHPETVWNPNRTTW